MTSQEYPDAVGDVKILEAIDTLLTRRDFSKSFNPVFGTVRPISELASKYVKSALLNAYEQVPMLTAEEMNGFLRELDPHYLRMSRICKNQLMHDMADQLIEMTPECNRAEMTKRIAKAVDEAKQNEGEDAFVSFDFVPEDLQNESPTTVDAPEVPEATYPEGTEFIGTASSGIPKRKSKHKTTKEKKEEIKVKNDEARADPVKAARALIRELREIPDTDELGKSNELKTLDKITKYQELFKEESENSPAARRGKWIQHYADAMGYGGLSRREIGSEWLREGANPMNEGDKADPIAQIYYADYLKSTLKFDGDPQSQVETYAQITSMYANAGDNLEEPNACAKRKLAQMYLNGYASEDGESFVSADEGVKKAFMLFSSNKDDALSQYYAGRMCESDNSLGDSAAFFTNAANLGHEPSIHKLNSAKVPEAYDMQRYFLDSSVQDQAKKTYMEAIANNGGYSYEGEADSNRFFNSSASRANRYNAFVTYANAVGLNPESYDYYKALKGANVGGYIKPGTDETVDMELNALEQRLLNSTDAKVKYAVARHALFEMLEGIKPFELSGGVLRMGDARSINSERIKELSHFCDPKDMRAFMAVAQWLALYNARYDAKEKILEAIQGEKGRNANLFNFFRDLDSGVMSPKTIYNTLLDYSDTVDGINPYVESVLIDIACKGMNTMSFTPGSANYSYDQSRSEIIEAIMAEHDFDYYTAETELKETMSRINEMLDLEEAYENEEDDATADELEKRIDWDLLDTLHEKYDIADGRFDDIDELRDFCDDNKEFCEEFCPTYAKYLWELQEGYEQTDFALETNNYSYLVDPEKDAKVINRIRSLKEGLGAGFGLSEEERTKLEELYGYYGLDLEQLKQEHKELSKENLAARLAAANATRDFDAFRLSTNGAFAQSHMSRLAKFLQTHPEWNGPFCRGTLDTFNQFSNGDLKLEGVLNEFAWDKAYNRLGTKSRNDWIRMANELAMSVFDSLSAGKNERGEPIDLTDPMAYARLHSSPGVKKPFAAALGGFCAENGRYPTLAKSFYAQASSDLMELVVNSEVEAQSPYAKHRILDQLYFQLIGDDVTKGLLCMDDIGYGEKPGENVRNTLIELKKESAHSGSRVALREAILKHSKEISKNLMAKATAYDITFQIFDQDSFKTSMAAKIDRFLNYDMEDDEIESFEATLENLKSYIEFVESPRKVTSALSMKFESDDKALEAMTTALKKIMEKPRDYDDIAEIFKDHNIVLPNAVIRSFAKDKDGVIGKTFARYTDMLAEDKKSLENQQETIQERFHIAADEITPSDAEMEALFLLRTGESKKSAACIDFKARVNALRRTENAIKITETAIANAKEAWAESLVPLLSGNGVLKKSIDMIRTSIAEKLAAEQHNIIYGARGEQNVGGLTAYLHYSTGIRDNVDQAEMSTILDMIMTARTKGYYVALSRKAEYHKTLSTCNTNIEASQFSVKLINHKMETLEKLSEQPEAIINAHFAPTDTPSTLNFGRRRLAMLDNGAQNEAGEIIDYPLHSVATYDLERIREEEIPFTAKDDETKVGVRCVTPNGTPVYTCIEVVPHDGTKPYIQETFSDIYYGDIVMKWVQNGDKWCLADSIKSMTPTGSISLREALSNSKEKFTKELADEKVLLQTRLVEKAQAVENYNERPSAMAGQILNNIDRLKSVYRILDVIRGTEDKSGEEKSWCDWISLDSKTASSEEKMRVANQVVDLGSLSKGKLWLACRKIDTLFADMSARIKEVYDSISEEDVLDSFALYVQKDATRYDLVPKDDTGKKQAITKELVAENPTFREMFEDYYRQYRYGEVYKALIDEFMKIRSTFNEVNSEVYSAIRSDKVREKVMEDALEEQLKTEVPEKDVIKPSGTSGINSGRIKTRQTKLF